MNSLTLAILPVMIQIQYEQSDSSHDSGTIRTSAIVPVMIQVQYATTKHSYGERASPTDLKSTITIFVKLTS